MIIQSCNLMIVRSAMKHLSYLLKETLSVQLSCAYKRILSEHYVLATKSSVKVVRQQVNGFLVPPVKYYLYCVLQIDAQLVLIQIFLALDALAFLSLFIFTFHCENWFAVRKIRWKTSNLFHFYALTLFLTKHRAIVIWKCRICASHYLGTGWLLV